MAHYDRLQIMGAAFAGALLAFWFCHVILGAENADKGVQIMAGGIMLCLLLKRRRARIDKVQGQKTR